MNPYPILLSPITRLLQVVLISFLPLINAHAGVDCTTSIQSIEIKGNNKIQPEYLLKWSNLHTGQQISQSDLIRARQDILNTGYFSEVSLLHDGLCRDKATITIQIKEKRYHLIYPRLSRNGDGDIEKGLRYRGYQLFGVDQNLSILVARKDYADGNTADRLGIDYELNLLNLPYLLRWGYQTIETLLTDTINPVIVQDEEFSFLVGREWHTPWTTHPVGVFTKLNLHAKSSDGTDTNVDIDSGDYNTIGAKLEYNRVNDEVIRHTGYYYSIELSKGLNSLASDSTAYRLRFETRYYHALNQLDNLNARFIFDLTSEKVFNQYNYSIGGSDSLRGIERGSITGNNLWLTNIEYVIGYKQWPSFRSSLFTDVGYVFKDYTSINDHDWRQTVGFGLRWKLTSFVKTDLVIDYGYDPKNNFSKIYLSTSLPF
jgi:outer membrane protein assembly factor BamA